jgi:hypothetical protein
MSGFDANAYRIVNSGTGTINQISMQAGHVFTIDDGGADVDAIYIEGVDHVGIRDVQFKDISTGNAVIYVKDSNHVSVEGCGGVLALSANTHFVEIDDDTTCDNWSVIDNVADVNGTGVMVSLIVDATTGNGYIGHNRIADAALALTSMTAANTVALPNTANEAITTLALTGATAVDNITGGKPGQLLAIVWAAAATFNVNDGSGGDGEFHLAGSAHLTGHISPDTLLVMSNGTDWFEISRSVN